MNWFKKAPLLDNTEVIYGDPDGMQKFRLVCDPELYAKGLDTIRGLLREWMIQDIVQTTSNGQKLETSLLYQIKDIDLKVLPYPVQKEVLLKCMEDTPMDYSGSRLLDTFVRINIEVPTEVLETVKGKFLYGMVYGLPKQIGEVVYPTKQDWLNLLSEVVWCPYLIFIQQLFDSDEITDRISKLTVAAKSQGTVVAPKVRMGG